MLIATSEAEDLAVDLTSIKSHLRIDHDEDDGLLESLTLSAIKHVENKTGWSLSATDYEWTIEDGDLKRSIPLYPAKVTSGQDLNGGQVSASIGDTVHFTTSVSHYKDVLRPAVLLYVQSMYEATADDQAKLESAINAICNSVRRSMGL